MEITTEYGFSDAQTTQDLKAALIAEFCPELVELDVTKLHFCMYLRKSTTGDEKQERSIEDQKADCLDAAVRLGITIRPEDIIEERESAKAPYIRPRFRQMVKDFQKGRYNGLLSYHPDRLSRNSMESGELIWLLEEGIIRSFQFATFTFENSPMGKMLLGMSFVLSKQYTDHLREVVMRGQRRSIMDGKYIHTPKHGYIKDVTQRLRPDTENDNWQLIKQAFGMRVDGKSIQVITDFLNKKGYTRAPAIGKDRSKYSIDTNRVSELLRDPVYCGVLIFGGTIVDLTEIYDFIPMISVEDFCKLNKISDLSKTLRSVKKVFEPGKKKADLLRGIVVCKSCGKCMSSGLTSDKSKDGEKSYRYYYKCETADCAMSKKSVPARIILGFVYDFLDKIDLTTVEFYNHTTAELERIADTRASELRSELRSTQQTIIERQKTFEKTREIIRQNEPEVVKYYIGDLKVIENDIQRLEGQVLDIEQQLANIKASIPSFEKYLETYKDVALKARITDNMILKDQIFRKFFSNIFIEGKKTSERSDGKPVITWEITGYILTPLYERLLESQFLTTGRPAMSILELVEFCIRRALDIRVFCEQLEAVLLLPEIGQSCMNLIY